MPFHDLNVAYVSDHAILANTLTFAKELGYDTIVLSVSVTGNLPSPLPSIPISSISRPDGIQLLSRLTLTISDTTQNFRLPTLGQSYDIIALRPTDEKTFQQCCTNLECDIISIDFTQRVSFLLKFKTVSSALQRGIRFEICYAPGIVADDNARRNLVAGATQIVRASRGRGILVNSGATSAMGLRAPWDVINLARVWGLSQERAKEAVCEDADRVVRLARMKRTSFRGVVEIIDGGAQVSSMKRDRESRAKPNSSVPTKDLKHRPGTTSEPSNDAGTVIGTKRKATPLSLNALQTRGQQSDEKPLSKNARKRQAKRARLEENTMSTIAVDGAHRVSLSGTNPPTLNNL